MTCLWREAGRRNRRSRGTADAEEGKATGMRMYVENSSCRIILPKANLPRLEICKENPHYLCAYDQQYVEGQEELRVIELVQSNLNY